MYRATTRLVEIDWQTWKPVDHATLLFVVRDSAPLARLRRDQVLLIRKKRGLGAGKINGPGGRIDPGETPLEAAVREVQEELRVTPTGIEPRGELLFQFTGGYSIHVHVFSASGCDGEAEETDEAIPLWTDLDRIPYGEMWADDVIWLPLMLEGTPFFGRFLFDGDAMLDHEIESGS